MAKLSSKARKSMPKSEFAGPGRSFPIPDRKHAKAALMDLNKSSISPSAKAKVRSRADAKLKSTDKKPKKRGDGMRKYAQDLNKRLR